MLIELMKDWLNIDDQYKSGDKLDISEDDGQKLIDEGIAKLVDTRNEKIHVARPAEIKKEVEDAVNKQLGENKAKEKPITLPDPNKISKSGGYDEMWQFAHDVYLAEKSKGRFVPEKLAKWTDECRLATKTTGHMSEADDAQGGFLVPEEFRAQLMQTLIEASSIRSRCTVIPMATNRIGIPTVNDSTHASSTHGGIILYRPGEGGTKNPSKPAFGKVLLTLHKLIGLIYASDELLEDSPISIEPLINTMFGQAFGFQEDEDFINGTGAGQPLGVLNAPCLVTQAKETGQAAATIVTENIVKMWSRLLPQSQKNAVWMANSDCFPQLATMSLAVGTGGSLAGLMQSTGATGTPVMTLMGRPLILTEHTQTLGAVGDIILCDWSQYLVGQKAGGSAIQTASSIHIAFTTDETAFRFVLRYDGQPWPLSDLTPRHSTATLSPFVALAVRE